MAMIRPERIRSFICSKAISMEVESQYSYMCGLKELILKAVGEESGEEKHLQVLRKTESYMSQEVAKLRSKPNRATKYVGYMRRLISCMKLMLNFLEDRQEETNAYPTLGVIMTHFINIMLTSSMKDKYLCAHIAAQSYSFVKMIFDNDVEYVLDVVLCSNIADDASASKSVGYYMLQEVVRDHKLFREDSAVFSKFCAAAHLLRDSHHSGKIFVETLYNEVTHFPSDLEEYLKANYGFTKEKARFSVSGVIEKIEPRKVILISRNKRLIVVPSKNRPKTLSRRNTKLVMGSTANNHSVFPATSSENFFYDVKGDYADYHDTEKSTFKNPVVTSEEDGSDSEQGDFQRLKPIYPLENMIDRHADSDGDCSAVAMGSHYSRVESSDGSEGNYADPESGDDDLKNNYVDYHDNDMEVEVTSTFENPIVTDEEKQDVSDQSDRQEDGSDHGDFKDGSEQGDLQDSSDRSDRKEDGTDQADLQALQPVNPPKNIIQSNADSDCDSSVVAVGSIRGVESSDDESERSFAEPESGDDEVPNYLDDEDDEFLYSLVTRFEDVQTSENINGPAQNINAPAENIDGPAQNINAPAENIDGPAQNINAPAENINGPTVRKTRGRSSTAVSAKTAALPATAKTATSPATAKTATSPATAKTAISPATAKRATSPATAKTAISPATAKRATSPATAKKTRLPVSGNSTRSRRRVNNDDTATPTPRKSARLNISKGK